MTVSELPQLLPRSSLESAAEAGMPPNPDVLDGIGQYLLLPSELRPSLPACLPHRLGRYPGEFVKLINRAKDELVSSADLEAFINP